MVRRTERASRAFTIVELLIVIVVIGILAAITIVGYGAVINNANDKSVQTDLAKLGDIVKLANLDNDSVPVGGATSSNIGDSTLLPGINFQPNPSAYDLKVSNLYYCEGTLGGIDEYAILARSQSGKAFSFISNKGISSFSGYTWTSANNGVAVCGLLGFSAPFTWSYGYLPVVNYGWLAWAYPGSLVTNLALNPSMETNISNWGAYTGLSVPTRVTSTPWAGVGRLAAVGNNSSVSPRVYTDVAASAGDVLSISYRVRSDSQIPTNALTSIKMMLSGSEISTIATTTKVWAVDASGWMNVTATATMPSGGDKLRFSLGVQSAVNYTGTMGIDGVIVASGSTAPVFADGSTTRWVWNGVANLSSSTGPPQ